MGTVPRPYLLKAEKDAADELPFLVWVYPLREYTTAKDENSLYEMYYGDSFICDAINDGFPLNCVVDADIFRETDQSVYQGRILVVPTSLTDSDILEKLFEMAKSGCKILFYGSNEALEESLLTGENVVRVSIDNPSELRKNLAKFGYEIEFQTKRKTKLPVWTMARSNNGCFFSVHNADTTTDSLWKFPLGAPILLGGETELVNGFAKYRFIRCEHRECRIFIKQKEGIISAFEQAPVSEKYRRRFMIAGLKNATVYYFPEKYCENFATITQTPTGDIEPELDEDWTEFIDPVFGKGFVGERKNGNIAFLMPFEKYI